MASVKLKFLKLSDLKVTPNWQKPIYIFIEANEKSIVDGSHAHTNHPNGGFSDLIDKTLMNTAKTN